MLSGDKLASNNGMFSVKYACEFNEYVPECVPCPPLHCGENSDIDCPTECIQNQDCYCLPGLFRNSQGRCVMEEDCGKLSLVFLLVCYISGKSESGNDSL